MQLSSGNIEFPRSTHLEKEKGEAIGLFCWKPLMNVEGSQLHWEGFGTALYGDGISFMLVFLFKTLTLNQGWLRRE